jgi:hypothetical protein
MQLITQSRKERQENPIDIGSGAVTDWVNLPLKLSCRIS